MRKKDPFPRSRNAPVDRGRRRLTLAGTAAPLLLALHSRSVWALNCSYSGQLSGNLSNPIDTCAGEGLSPGYWKTHTDQWHVDFPPAALFNDVFGVNVFASGATLQAVIDKTATIDSNYCSGSRSLGFDNLVKALGMQAVAALQNAASPLKYDLTVAEVVDSVSTAYASCNQATIENLKNTLDSYNNQGGIL